MDRQPLLSIVVTIVEGGEALSRCLDALREQAGNVPLEVIVPVDASVAGVAALRERFPEACFLDLATITAAHPLRNPAGQHELYDRRRAAGLAAATADLIAIVEDRCIPRPEWARTAVRLHAEHSCSVIGGAIEPVPGNLLNWAFWACDFSRYGLPFASGPVRWVSDVNVTYKRTALAATRDLWRERYQEPVVHWALLERGETLYLAADLIVDHRLAPLRLGPLLPERFQWGRLFGAIRARHSPLSRRLLLAAASPLLPVVLLARHGRAASRRGESGRFLRATPFVLLLLIAWSAGEAWGHLTGRS